MVGPASVEPTNTMTYIMMSGKLWVEADQGKHEAGLKQGDVDPRIPGHLSRICSTSSQPKHLCLPSFEWVLPLGLYFSFYIT